MKPLIPALIVCILLCGCDKRREAKTQIQEQNRTEDQQRVHLKTSPPPKLTRSQERLNLIERLTRFNTDSKVSYIYLVNYGKVMAFYTVKGKVSSVNSLLTTPDQLIKPKNISERHVMASPDLDGSYGSNGDAVFFFTTDGTYVEWSGDYMLCDKPLKLTTPPELTIDVTDQTTGGQ